MVLAMKKICYPAVLVCLVSLHTGTALAEGESLQACSNNGFAKTELGQNLAKNPLVIAVSANGKVSPVCTQSITDGSVTVTIAAASGNAVTVSLDPAIESSSYEATLAGLSPTSANTLLKATEKYLFGDEGCSIDWKHSHHQPGENGTSLIVFQARGDGNNCMAKEISRGGTLIGVSLSNAS
jgi:hypothetical protein